MYKKDFEEIARILNKYYDNSPAVEMLLVDNAVNEKIIEIAEDLMDYLGTRNKNFDRNKFRRAVMR